MRFQVASTVIEHGGQSITATVSADAIPATQRNPSYGTAKAMCLRSKDGVGRTATHPGGRARAACSRGQARCDIRRRASEVGQDGKGRNCLCVVDGVFDVNICSRGGRLYTGDRREKIWPEDTETAFLDVAPRHLAEAELLAVWTGQRQGEKRTAYDGQNIHARQSKSIGKRRKVVHVTVPVAGPLKIVLDALLVRHDANTTLVTEDGKPWQPDRRGSFNGFRASWRKACEKAGIRDLTFNDLRGTAVTRLALAGSTEAQIATVTGHALAEVKSILDANYLNRDPELARQAIKNLEMRYAALAWRPVVIADTKPQPTADVVRLRTRKRAMTSKRAAYLERQARAS